MTPALACLLGCWAALAQMPAPRLQILDRAPVLDVNAGAFPASSMVDFGREPKPVGACGRVFVGTDGKLYFQDGSRAIFWGINVAKESIFQPRAVIDRAVNAIAAAGFNLVRLHHFDDVTGLLPRDRAGKTPRIDPDKLACLDYWIKKLGERGIYVYLDLNDYRTFWPEEGVPDGEALGRGAKPYAVFVPRLIQLQAQYARELLCDHVNPLTGKTYAQDPAVLFIELCDENGLFRAWRAGLKLRQPYANMLRDMFDKWLRARYGTDDALRRAWTNAAGECCLRPGESLAAGNVALSAKPGTSGRDTDTALFFAKVHRHYFDTLRAAMHTGGVRELLIGGVADPTIPADLRAAARGLDFVGTNWYWDHPIFRPGHPWELPYTFHNASPTTADDLDEFPVVAAAARVAGKPLVIREWNGVWPNEYRATAMLEAAAYGCLQDVDALILFDYGDEPDHRGLGLFDVSHDPTRWGLAALCGAIFRGRLVAPAKHSAVIGYSPADVLLDPLRPMASPLHKLGYFCRVYNDFFESRLGDTDGADLAGGVQGAPGAGGAGGASGSGATPAFSPLASADLVISSGRSSEGRYPTRDCLLFSRSPYADPYAHRRTAGLAALNGCSVATLPTTQATFGFGGTIFDGGVSRDLDAVTPYFLPDIANTPDLRPIGVCRAAGAALGVRNMKLGRYSFGAIPDDWAFRASLDAMGQLTGDEVFSHRALDDNRLIADGGELTIDRTRNLLLVAAPRVLAAAGDFGGGPVRAGALEVTTATPRGAIVWVSLDGKPARDSRRWVLKMVSVARNTGQKTELERHGTPFDAWRFSLAGKAPVLTDGHAGAPTTVTLAGRPLLRIDLVDGTWELVRDAESLYLWCDTPGTSFASGLLPARCGVTTLAADRKRSFAANQPQPLQYPGGALLVKLAPVSG